MKAERQFYSLIFSVFRKVFSVLFLKVKICFSPVFFFYFHWFNFLRFRARCAFFCDRRHLMQALKNVSGISEKNASKQKQSTFCHVYDNQLVIPNKILNRTRTVENLKNLWNFYFPDTSRYPHAKNYVILHINKGVISLWSPSCFENFRNPKSVRDKEILFSSWITRSVLLSLWSGPISNGKLPLLHLLGWDTYIKYRHNY